jgi:hypothetical protein
MYASGSGGRGWSSTPNIPVHAGALERVSTSTGITEAGGVTRRPLCVFVARALARLPRRAPDGGADAEHCDGGERPERCQQPCGREATPC